MPAAWGSGLTTITDDGVTLDAWFPELGWGEVPAPTFAPIEARHDAARGVDIRPLTLVIDTDAPPTDGERRVPPVAPAVGSARPAPIVESLDGAFGLLANVAWTNLGPVAPADLVAVQLVPNGPPASVVDGAQRRQVPPDARLRGTERRWNRRPNQVRPGRPPGRGHRGDARGVLQLQRRDARDVDGRGPHLGRRDRRRRLGHRRGCLDHGHPVRRRQGGRVGRPALPARRQRRDRHQPR